MKSDLRLFDKYRIPYFKGKHTMLDLDSITKGGAISIKGFYQSPFTEHFAFRFGTKNKHKELWLSDDGTMTLY